MRRLALAAAAAGLLCGCDEKQTASNGAPPASSLERPTPPAFGKAPQGTGGGSREAASEYAGAASPSAAPGSQSYERLSSAFAAPGALFDGSRDLQPTAEPVAVQPSEPDPTVQAQPEHWSPAGAPKRLVATFRRRRSDRTPVRVYAAEGPQGRSLSYESGMTICTDGRIADPTLAARIRREDPDHLGGTALAYRNGLPLDPTRVPFIVLPTGFAGAQTGDLALVQYQGRQVFAVVGDRGPRSSIGEASVAVAQALGINAHGGKGGVRSGVRYVVFPGSGSRRPRNESELLAFINSDGPMIAAGRRPITLASL